jgi:hypothetical protein
MGGGLGAPMGGPPPGGGQPGSITPPIKLKAYNVWDVLEKLYSK